ncbi:hypothetical protein [uncultured Bacteroides sp.]|uniref:hypothetical protein n=1 Tax=uncultured Bacteroides sp. TaxID=162156 RepID=UPI002AA7140C|nr:hypothetical protein [uncultured Bacteroides sp.]
MKKINILFFILLFLTELPINAINEEWKSGCIITNKGDTIHGFLAYRNGMGDWKECLFKNNLSDKEIIYNPHQIQGYLYNIGLYYKSIDLKAEGEENRYFAECLVEGAISLYRLKMSGERSFESYYAINTSSGKIVSFPTQNQSYIQKERIRNSIRAILNYNEQLKKDIKETDCSRSSIIALFKKYHTLTCSQFSCISYQEPKHKCNTYISPFVGIQFNKNYCIIQTSGINYSLNNNSPLIGGNFQMSLDKISNKLLFEFGINANQIKINGYQSPILKVNFSAIQIANNIGVEYVYNINNKTHLLFQGGYNQYLMCPTKNEVTLSKGRIEVKTYHPGYYIGTGLVFSIDENHSIPVRINYSRLIYFQKDLSVLNDNVSLSVGYTFNL